MSIQRRKEAFLLLFGDVLIFVLSLWLMLIVRYGELPSKELFDLHLVPFSLLFIVWILIFFIAGLYEKHTTILKHKLAPVIFNAQIVNIVLAISFFYLIPYFGITPKTNLFLYLAISIALILPWRLNGYKRFDIRKRQNALLIGSGEEMRQLKKEVNDNSRYSLTFISTIDLDDVSDLDFQEEVVRRVYADEVTVIVADLKNDKVQPILPHLYNLIFSKVRFIDMHRVYEDIFDRIPLSLVQYNWFLENISVAPKITYDIIKRIMDIVLAFVVGVMSLVLYPLIFLAIKLDDGGKLFFLQDRIGKNNKPVKIFKFRSMSEQSGDASGAERSVDAVASATAQEDAYGTETKKITRVGKFLRRTRLDELPQLWNVVRGDLSLIGPRPEIPTLANEYEEQISYYNIRHLIKPGLSGWAQIYHDNHPHHLSDVGETKVKLSYDLFYIKNRSFVLDLKIALKTLKKLASRAGK